MSEALYDKPIFNSPYEASCVRSQSEEPITVSNGRLPDGLWLRGRWFTFADIEVIKSTVQEYYDDGRTKASEAICRRLDWKQPNGWLKDRACRDVLLQLERLALLQLPPRRADARGNATRAASRKSFATVFQTPDTVQQLDRRMIRIAQVKGSQQEPLWNWLVASHHYLGFTVGVGRCLKYLVYQGDTPVAALAFATAAWAVGARDRAMALLGYSRESLRDLIVGNGRFVVFPWASVPNLASCALACCLRALPRDWQDFYAVAPHAVETFVDTTMFTGTTYRAANWLTLGHTRGFRKSGGTHRNGQSRKAVLLYPFSSDLRRRLVAVMRSDRNELSHKRSNP